MINETRASTERRMIEDVQELLRQGEEVNQQDSQGATLVRRCSNEAEPFYFILKFKPFPLDEDRADMVLNVLQDVIRTN